MSLILLNSDKLRNLQRWILRNLATYFGMGVLYRGPGEGKRSLKMRAIYVLSNKRSYSHGNCIKYKDRMEKGRMLHNYYTFRAIDQFFLNSLPNLLQYLPPCSVFHVSVRKPTMRSAEGIWNLEYFENCEGTKLQSGLDCVSLPSQLTKLYWKYKNWSLTL